VWVLPYARKWSFWISLFAFVALGICLVLTESRGGIVGLMVGGIFLVAWAPRPFPRAKTVAVFVACVGLAIFALTLGSQSRYEKAVTGDDLSIQNRLLIWKEVPTMLADAPHGWGLGKSGDAYMQWYQPVTRGEGYRTLVNSHFTWLVEMGWWGRGFYLGGWIAVLILLWPDVRHREFAIAFGLWAAFATCAFFSSVAEAWPLWIISAGALLAVLIARGKDQFWPQPRMWIGGVITLIVVLLALLGLGEANRGSFIQCPTPGVVTLGTTKPQIWIVSPDPKVLGEHYGHEIRQGFQSEPVYGQKGLGVVANPREIPSGSEALVCSGKIPAQVSSAKTQQIIVVAPGSMLTLKGIPSRTKVTLIIGQFSSQLRPWLDEARQVPNLKVLSVDGCEDYIPNWMHESALALRE
jgi:hypothetical protein